MIWLKCYTPTTFISIFEIHYNKAIRLNGIMNKSVSSIERQVNSNILTVKELIEDLMKDVRLNAKNAGKTKRDELNNKEQLKLLKKIQTQLNILKTEITNVYNIKTNNTNSTEQRRLF